MAHDLDGAIADVVGLLLLRRSAVFCVRQMLLDQCPESFDLFLGFGAVDPFCHDLGVQ